MWSEEELEQALAAEQQRQQVIVAQINQIISQQQQMEVQKQQLTQEAFTVQGKIEAYEQQLAKGEEDGTEGKMLKFPGQEAED